MNHVKGLENWRGVRNHADFTGSASVIFPVSGMWQRNTAQALLLGIALAGLALSPRLAARQPLEPAFTTIFPAPGPWSVLFCGWIVQIIFPRMCDENNLRKTRWEIKGHCQTMIKVHVSSFASWHKSTPFRDLNDI